MLSEREETGTLIDRALLKINSKIGELWPKVYGLSQPRHCSKLCSPCLGCTIAVGVVINTTACSLSHP